MEADGQEVLHARGWRIERPAGAVPEVADGGPPAPVPAAGDGFPPLIFRREQHGYLASIEWRFVPGDFDEQRIGPGDFDRVVARLRRLAHLAGAAHDPDAQQDLRHVGGEGPGEPLADGLTRGEALRWGALLHDAAKPLTRGVRPGDGRVTFIGHDERGAALAREVLGRLRSSERLRGHVAALVRHHLRLGFLVHERQPLSRRTVFAYLRATDPVEVDVTLLSVADRLATRGDRAQEAIAAHLAVAEDMLGDALRWRVQSAMEDVTYVTTPTKPGLGVGAYNLLDLFAAYSLTTTWTVRAAKPRSA